MIKLVEAHRWFTNGDHPEDNQSSFINSRTGKSFLGEGGVVRYYRRPEPQFSGDKLCPDCEGRLHDHGWIEGNDFKVCPGDWIIRNAMGEYYPVSNSFFENNFDGELTNG